MDIFTAAEELTGYLASVTGLEEGKSIFPGEIPQGVREGIAVVLTGGIPGNRNNVNVFDFLVTGYSADREKLWSFFTRIFEDLPQENLPGFLCLAADDEVAFSRPEKDGIRLFCCEMTIQASFV